jgi:hypothetical protein
MVNASGVEAAQRDRGEARRNGVISRPFRRLCVSPVIGSRVVATGSPEAESVRYADLWTVGRAVLCPPVGCRKSARTE